jgi:nitrous oxidase accessory protein NosD
VTSTSGDCITIRSATNVVVRASEIGPCAGNGITVTGGGSVTIEDNYIHPEHPPAACCDTGDGVFATGTSSLLIAGNVIAYGEANIEVNTSNGVKVVGNFLLNPQNSNGSRGQNFQSWGATQNVDIENNYALSSQSASYRMPERQEDSINFGLTDGITVKNNYVTGGHSGSGCGIIADDAANNAQFVGNVLVDTGQCGIGIADGTTATVQGNRILNRTPVSGAGNTAIYVWKQYSSGCGPVQITGNVAAMVLSPGVFNTYWNGGGCEPVTSSGNTFDQAALAALTPVPPPPLIPPAPVGCVAPSPYSTQTGFPKCAGP